MLPERFMERMNHLLSKSEYEEFVKRLEAEKRYVSLRINPLKGDGELVRQCFATGSVPWCETGFYYDNEKRPGKHILHEGGAYYIQEPSAMAPAVYLDVKPGEKVLDLCAAPGGKSTQIAGAMMGEGILISNEIHPARAKILSENMERMGVKNAIVTNETPQNLAKIFVSYFDKIMVDAPCSGEGMFRKNDNAAGEWSEEHVTMCASRQREILDIAADMLHPGGTIVYSTCTFAPEENENTIADFLLHHPEFYTEEVKLYDGMEHGRAKWCGEYAKDSDDFCKGTIRLWPHKLQGEGHFLAVLKKRGKGDRSDVISKNGIIAGMKESELKEVYAFVKENLNIPLRGTFVRFKDAIYLLPEDAPSLRQIKVLRAGLCIGIMRKNRFEPEHALAMALKKDEAKHVVNLSMDDPHGKAYLRGETFEWEGEKGWYLITCEGYSLGWGKLAGQVMKNHYPKGLRKNI